MINTLDIKCIYIKRLASTHYLTLYLAYDQISNIHHITDCETSFFNTMLMYISKISKFSRCLVASVIKQSVNYLYLFVENITINYNVILVNAYIKILRLKYF